MAWANPCGAGLSPSVEPLCVSPVPASIPFAELFASKARSCICGAYRVDTSDFASRPHGQKFEAHGLFHCFYEGEEHDEA